MYKTVLIIAVFLISFYIYSILMPLFTFDWLYRWQTAIAAIMALGTALLILTITQSRLDRQRKSEFIAARAFLPEALSELQSYFKSCIAMIESPTSSKFPELPSGYKDIFSSCIRSADIHECKYLTKILTLLQINNSRLKDRFSSTSDPDEGIGMEHYVDIGELQALTSNLFSFARGKEDTIPDSGLTLDDMENAYLCLEISNPDYVIEYTKKRFPKSWK